MARNFDLGSAMIDPLYIGLAAGVLTSMAMLPQLIKIVREKRAGDISLTMLLVLITGLGLWIVYGGLEQDVPLLITNSFAFVLNLVAFFFSYKYRNR